MAPVGKSNDSDCVECHSKLLNLLSQQSDIVFFFCAEAVLNPAPNVTNVLPTPKVKGEVKRSKGKGKGKKLNLLELPAFHL